MTLWDRGSSTDACIAEFTVGNDYLLDRVLVPFDALASFAHATMLCKIGVVDGTVLPALRDELRAIAEAARDGTFTITAAQEDGHTAIEQRLTDKLGEVGQRIHTGRSRNDQVLAALRLYGRQAVLRIVELTCEVAHLLLALADRYRDVTMAGYTHLRQAMPSTLGYFFAAYAENLLDDVPWLSQAYAHLNRSPLGSASGFGVALPLDRQQVADLLVFDSVQVNGLGVQNDRGKTEFMVVGALLSVTNDLGRLAHDLILYSTDEFGYIKLADEVTTGSSIMPQKRNPDVLELIRATAARLRASHQEIGQIYASLPGGYYRDMQLTKEPFLKSMKGGMDLLSAMQPVLASLTVDQQRCADAVQPTTCATDEVYRRVGQGQAFRQAYRDVAKDPVAALSQLSPQARLQTWQQRTYLGAPGEPGLNIATSQTRRIAAQTWVTQTRTSLQPCWQLLGVDAASFSQLP